MHHKERIQSFVQEIWQWYARHKRMLPWRDLAIEDDTQRAYMILVSEVMLQQTQVPRVVVIFKQFIERFPTMRHLAKATNRQVLIAWRGMGYNSRALRLRDAARVIREGEFPRSMEELQKIPGIGPYTAAAIRNFAFGISTPCVDVNIERILARVFGVKAEKRIGKKAGEVLRIAFDTKNWHAALMDFGSSVCTKRSPKCGQCPLSRGVCKSAFRVPSLDSVRDDTRREPGRLVGGKFIPNRIFRGKVVDLLRDYPKGLMLGKIGQEVCIDWEGGSLRGWMAILLRNLENDGLIARRGHAYFLPH